MRNILIMLLFISSFSIADTQKDQTIENKLTTVLHNLKKFKKEKNHQISKLERELKSLKKEFNNYRIKKEKEVKKIRNKLRQTQKELLKNKIQNKHKIQNMQNKLLSSQKKLEQKETITHLNIQQSMEKAMAEPIPIQIEIQTQENPSLEQIILPIKSNIPWAEITIEENIDIYQLAKLYYGDSNEYVQIYSANREIIPNNLKLHNGMRIKIPMTSKFRDQPIVLNRD